MKRKELYCETMEINEKTRVEELLNACGRMEEFFVQRGMYCKTCKGRVNCTLKKVAYYYGLLPLENWLEEVRGYYKKVCQKPKVVKSPSRE